MAAAPQRPNRGRTIMPIKWQTGTVKDLERDRARKHALPPGMRISANGKKYFEGRKNRSDLHGNI